MKNLWKVIKVNNKWVIYNTENGMMLTKLVGKGTKKEALESCKMFNKYSYSPEYKCAEDVLENDNLRSVAFDNRSDFNL